jgi:hypothetical protein
MNEILRDRQLADLIAHCESAFRALNATFVFDEPTPDELRDLIDKAMGALGEAVDYLQELRLQMHAA